MCVAEVWIKRPKDKGLQPVKVATLCALYALRRNQLMLVFCCDPVQSLQRPVNSI